LRTEPLVSPVRPPASSRRSTTFSASASALIRETLLLVPGFEEGRLLRELEHWFYRLTARRFDRDLSLELLSILKEAYSEDERAGFARLLEEFAEANLDKLEDI
jgi:hypothetical protein